MAEQSITLAPGESRLVSFEATPQGARTYQVAVNGLSGSFKATTPYPVTISNMSIRSPIYDQLDYWYNPYQIVNYSMTLKAARRVPEVVGTGSCSIYVTVDLWDAQGHTARAKIGAVPPYREPESPMFYYLPPGTRSWGSNGSFYLKNSGIYPPIQLAWRLTVEIRDGGIGNALVGEGIGEGTLWYGG